MKPILFFSLICILFSSFSILAQNKTDSNFLLRANNYIRFNDYSNGERQLKKNSTNRQKNSEVLFTRADCNEKLQAYQYASDNYNAVYIKTAEKNFTDNTPLMMLKLNDRLGKESLVQNCKLCKGSGNIYEYRTCNYCNGQKSLHVTCGNCRGLGNLQCFNCSGSGKITRILASSADGQKVTEESVCNICSGTGQKICNQCHGDLVQKIKCNYCNGLGQTKVLIKCPKHH